jgi:hypothetical protein
VDVEATTSRLFFHVEAVAPDSCAVVTEEVGLQLVIGWVVTLVAPDRQWRPGAMKRGWQGLPAWVDVALGCFCFHAGGSGPGFGVTAMV